MLFNVNFDFAVFIGDIQLHSVQNILQLLLNQVIFSCNTRTTSMNASVGKICLNMTVICFLFFVFVFKRFCCLHLKSVLIHSVHMDYLIYLIQMNLQILSEPAGCLSVSHALVHLKAISHRN